MELDLNEIEDELEKIPVYRGYAADSEGNIWSLNSNWRGYGKRKMKLELSKDGYLMVRLTNGTDKRMRKSVHRLVCMAFKGTPPQGKNCCLHIDGNKINNKPSNLRWGTHEENEKDSLLHGTKAIGTRHGRAQLTEEEVYEIKKQIKEKRKLKEIAKDFNVGAGAISQIKRNNVWKRVDVSKHESLADKLSNEIKEKDERISALVKSVMELENQINSQNNIIDSLFSQINYYENTVFTEGLRIEQNINSDLESVHVKTPDIKKISIILRENEMLKNILKLRRGSDEV